MVVASPGPPLVITQICTKALKVQMISSENTSMKIGRIMGKVMARKMRRAEAPSMRADSYSSAGTVVRAEYRVMAANGTDCQTISRTRMVKAAGPCANQG